MLNDPVADFEQRFARKIGSPYAISVNSGTSALHAALVACDVRGGEVIMPALCPAMDAFTIIHAGATPVFADVDPLTHLVTHETIVRCITSRTRAVIAVALHGLGVDIDPIMELAKSRGFFVIEDCAQALLARYKNGFAGTKADFGCYSFELKKHMTTGSEGGMIVTSNPDLATKARKFAGIGYKHMTAETGRTSLNASTFQRPDYARFDTIGLNYRMSRAQAEIGIKALNDVEDRIHLRQEIGFRWQSVLGSTLQPHLYDADNTFYSAAWRYPGDDWVGFYNEFVEMGGDGFYAMPLCPYREPALDDPDDRSKYGMTSFGPNCPTAEMLQSKLMCFKTHYQNEDMIWKQMKIMSRMIQKHKWS